MKAKIVSDQTKSLQKRFFDAIDTLILTGELAGMQTFCTEHDLHKAKYSNLRTATRNPEHDPRYKIIDIDAIVYLVKEYKVSSEWLLLGKGLMFK